MARCPELPHVQKRGQITVKDAKNSQACPVLADSRNIILATFQIFVLSHRLGQEAKLDVIGDTSA
jgi:hypothetical protein